MRKKRKTVAVLMIFLMFFTFFSGINVSVGATKSLEDIIADAIGAIQKFSTLTDAQMNFLCTKAEDVASLDLFPEEKAMLHGKDVEPADLQGIVTAIRNGIADSPGGSTFSNFRIKVQEPDYVYLIDVVGAVKAAIPDAIKTALINKNITEEDILLTWLDLFSSGVDFFNIDDNFKATVEGILDAHGMLEHKEWFSFFGVKYANLESYINNLSPSDKLMLSQITEALNDTFVASPEINLPSGTYVGTQTTHLAFTGGTVKYLLVNEALTGTAAENAANIWANGTVYTVGVPVQLPQVSGQITTYYLYAVRKVGEQLSVPVSRNYTIYPDAISVTVTAPANNSFTKTQTVAVTGTTLKNAGITITVVTTPPDGIPPRPETAEGTADADGTFSVPASLAYGSNAITVVAAAGGGVVSQPVTRTVVYDNIAPTVTVTPLAPTQNPSISISGSYVEDYVDRIELTVNGVAAGSATLNTTAKTFVKSHLLAADGTHTIAAAIYDRAGNTGTGGPVTVLLDRIAPVINSVTLTPVAGSGNSANLNFSAAVTEANSLKENLIQAYIGDLSYTIQSKNVINSGGSNWTVSGTLQNVPQGVVTFKLVVVDSVDLSGQYIETITVDTIPPTTLVSVTRAQDDTGVSPWYRIKPTVTLSASEATVYYKVNGGVEHSGNSPLNVAGAHLIDGTNTIEYRSVDLAGNQETPKQIEVKIDLTDPVIPSITAVTPAAGKAMIPGPLAGQYITNTTTFNVAGTTAAGVTSVRLNRLAADGVTIIPVATANVVDGNFIFNNIPLERDLSNYRIRAVAPSGRVSGPAEFRIIRDVTGPIFTITVNEAAKTLTIVSSEQVKGNTITVTATTEGSPFAPFSGNIELTEDGGKWGTTILAVVDLPAELTVTVRGSDLLDQPGHGAFTRTVITAGGGFIDTGKVRVDFSDGSLTKDTSINVSSIVVPKEPPAGFEDLGGATRFVAPPGESFELPVQVEMYITWVPGLNLAGVQLFYYNATDDEWEEVEEFQTSYQKRTADVWNNYGAGEEPIAGDDARIVVKFSRSSFSVYAALVDTTPPDLDVTSPVDGLVTKQRTITVTGTTEAGATVTINGTPGVVSGAGGFSKDIILASDGSHVITVVAKDAANNSTTVQVTVTCDSQAPVITLGQGDNISTNNANITISGSTDESATIKIYRNNVLQSTTLTGVGHTFNKIIALIDGANIIKVEAADSLGNTSDKSITVTYSTTKPTLSYTAPAYTNQTPITITGTTNALTLTIRVNGSVSEGVNITTQSFSKAVTLTANSSNVIVLTAVDVFGNTSIATFTVTHDNLPPVLVVDVPAATTTNASINITGTTEAGSSIWVNGVEKITSVGAEGTFSVSVALNVGVNTIQVKAKDRAGNESTSTVTVERTAVTPPPSSPPPSPPKEEVKADAKPGVSTTLATESGDFQVTLPAGSLNKEATVTITEVPEEERQAPRPGTIMIGTQQFRIQVEDRDGNSIREFAKDLIINAAYTDEDIPAGINESDLKICYWDENVIDPTTGQKGAWIAIPTTVDIANNKVTGRVNHLTIFTVMFLDKFPALSDIKAHWAETDIMKLVSLKIASGDPSGDFRPEDRITREEFAKLAVLAAGLKPVANPVLSFTDASKISPWARGYVAAAVNAGIIIGYDDNTFRAKKDISRAEISVIVVRALKANVSKQPKVGFSDAADIPSWALPYVAKAAEVKIITGFPDATFRASESASRAQSAAMISRMLSVR